MAFEARFPGICDDCGQGFRAGTNVTYNEDSKIVHVTCRSTKMGPVCPVCHETRSLSGSCACD